MASSLRWRGWIAVSAAYGLLYSALCIGLSLWIFNFREF
jgi:hypothetical protein